MSDALFQLAAVSLLKSNQARDDANSVVTSQRQALTTAQISKALAALGPRRGSTPQQTMIAQRLAIKLRTFRSTLPGDEAAVLDDWLDRAASVS
jgi:hypothetical protein